MLTSVETESLAERAGQLWRGAHRPDVGRLELYAKLSDRVRIERRASASDPSLQHVNDSGIAVRTFDQGASCARFAACTGFSEAALDWAVRASVAQGHPVTAATPEISDAIPRDRSDLDPALVLPSGPEMRAWLERDRSISWIEAGITSEVLIGPSGWIAMRRRQRIWAGATSKGKLGAARVASKWEDALIAAMAETWVPRVEISKQSRCLVFLPEAGAPIVTALVRRFHSAPAASDVLGGLGWSVVDDPELPDGLVGGAIDDAGFPSKALILGDRGAVIGNFGHPHGCFRRRSFREAPIPGPSNLVVRENGQDGDTAARGVVDRCRVLPLAVDVWVLELDLMGDTERHYLRTAPERLLAGCRLALGPPRVTPDGPAVAALVFEGLEESEGP